MPSLRISWRRGALAAYASKERDEGVASPGHSVHHRIILSMLISVRIVHVCDDFASSTARPDSQVAPVFDWRESPVTDRRHLRLRRSRAKKYPA